MPEAHTVLWLMLGCLECLVAGCAVAAPQLAAVVWVAFHPVLTVNASSDDVNE